MIRFRDSLQRVGRSTWLPLLILSVLVPTWLIGQSSVPDPANTLFGGGGGVAGLSNGCGAGTAIADNAVLRGDGTTGCQGSDVTIADASGSSVTAATTAGNALVWTSTAPAQTASAQAGVNAQFRASDAIAGSSNAGAAAGGTTTIRGGDAKRLTSGNANGGDVIINGGAGIGTGTLGQVRINNSAIAVGTAAIPAFAIGSGAAGIYTDSNAEFIFVKNSGNMVKIDVSNGSVVLSSRLAWTASDAIAAQDTILKRAAAGVVSFVDSTGGNNTGFFTYAGQSRVTGDTTLDSISPATMTLTPTYTLANSRTYSFECHIYANTPTAADGFRVDFDGGTVAIAAGGFRAHVKGFDQTGAITASAASSSTALATDLTWTSTTGDAEYVLTGTITVGAAGTGTFIPRYAKEADAGAAATIYRGSFCWMQDMP